MRKEIKRLETENTALETKLKHARGQIDHEMNKRMKAEQDKETLERQISLVRDLLTEKNNKSLLNDRDRERLAFLSYQPSTYDSPQGHDGYNQRDPHLNTIDESGDLLSEIDYDKTEEDMETCLRSGGRYKRPSAPPIEDEITPPEKRTKRQSRSQKKRKSHRRSNSAVLTTTTVTVTPDGPIEAAAEISAERRRRNSSPGKRFKKENFEEEYNRNNNARNGILKDTNSKSPGSPILKRYGSAGRGMNRPHDFGPKTVIRPETCQVCNKRIKFSKLVLKCKDCRATAHPNCKEQVPLPCVPITPGSTTNRPNGAYELSDFTSEAPMIPALIIHCVNEVESRGLNEVGLYRLSGSDREVKELKDRFMKGRTPNLTNVSDVNVICGCLKDFLRGLKEPLLTLKLWSDFAKASEIKDRDERLACIYQAVSQLPQSNRDTLAFLIIHLQRVAEATECQMPATNLAKIFGPTVMGYSSEQPEPMQMIDETRKQTAVLLRLIEISSDYWTNFIEDNGITDGIIRDFQTPQTPEVTAVPQSMLGPVYASGYDSEERRSYSVRPEMTSRNVRRNPAHFFDSPKYN